MKRWQCSENLLLLSVPVCKLLAQHQILHYTQQIHIRNKTVDSTELAGTWHTIWCVRKVWHDIYEQFFDCCNCCLRGIRMYSVMVKADFSSETSIIFNFQLMITSARNLSLWCNSYPRKHNLSIWWRYWGILGLGNKGITMETVHL